MAIRELLGELADLEEGWKAADTVFRRDSLDSKLENFLQYLPASIDKEFIKNVCKKLRIFWAF